VKFIEALLMTESSDDLTFVKFEGLSKVSLFHLNVSSQSNCLDCIYECVPLSCSALPPTKT